VEWVRLDAKTKQPLAIAMKDGKPYALAGLWERADLQSSGRVLVIQETPAKRVDCGAEMRL
jgi:putative SOS response-associated peptidase YedK